MDGILEIVLRLHRNAPDCYNLNSPAKDGQESKEHVIVANAKPITLKLMPKEYWWGGVVRDGDRMPYGARENYRHALCPNLKGNQGCPILVSSAGRYIWSEEPFTFEFKDGALTITEQLGEIVVGEGHGNLKGAHLDACRKFFPPTGRIPHELCFLAPQYNSWIHVQKYPTQEKVLAYAQTVLDAKMPPGVLMIDDFWYRNCGLWRWDSEAFPDPKKMVEQLHRQGFLVVLWICPWVTADTRQYEMLRDEGFLIREAPKKWAIQEWWNGYSAILDLSNPGAFAWFQGELDKLVADFGIDGFKFDGGDPYRYSPNYLTYAPRNPNGHGEDFGRIGLKYGISEYRGCWKLGGTHLIQRVRDKQHIWTRDGMADLIPSGIAQGLMGYPYSCPDMVGSGQLGSFAGRPEVKDPELFVRWAQLSTFFPIIQYSLLPARYLTGEHLDLTMRMVALRMKIAPEILALATHASKTGEPILRHMAYEFPGEEMETVQDQYMLGGKYLVAPVVTQGARSRRIRFPSGTWRGEDDSIVKGPCEMEVDAPLSRLPYYVREA